MRLFISIHFNHDTHTQLIGLCEALRTHARHGNISRPENLHLTLAFLGECDTKQTAAVKKVMNSITFQPFDIAIDRLGSFKHDGEDLWWAGIQTCKPLLDLQKDLSDKLISAGFRLETRPYKPHITLGREIAADIEPWEIEPFGETVTSIQLMKSERLQGKLTYTPIHQIKAILED